MAQVTNSGVIGAFADDYAVGVLLSGGPAVLHNSGGILAAASIRDPDLISGSSIGILTNNKTTIFNSGTISGTYASIKSEATTLLILETGSNLTGTVYLKGEADTLTLTGNGSEDDLFPEWKP